MTAINSHVTREIAADCAMHKPDLFIVYMGNNEVIGPYGPGTVFQGWSPSLTFIRASTRIKSTRLGQFLGNVAAYFRTSKDVPDKWLGLEMFQNNHAVADDPRLNTVYGNFRRNLVDVCDIGRRAGAAVIVATVAVNLRDFPPLASEHRPDLAASEREAWDTVYRDGATLEAAGRWKDAGEKFEAVNRIDEHFAELHFRLARCYFAQRRFADALAAFQRACDLDALRFRADSRINAAIRDVASERGNSGVYLADAENSLAGAAPDSCKIPGSELFFEHVHLNFDGNYLLARTVLDQVETALPELAAKSRPGTVLSRNQCARAMALTPWDELKMATDMIRMTSEEPFVRQLGHEKYTAAAIARADELRRQSSTPAAFAEAVKTYEAAIALRGDDWEMRYNYGRLAMSFGRADLAAQQWQAALEAIPGESNLQMYVGDALCHQGKLPEAIAAYEKALQIKADYPEAWSISVGASARAGDGRGRRTVA